MLLGFFYGPGEFFHPSLFDFIAEQCLQGFGIGLCTRPVPAAVQKCNVVWCDAREVWLALWPLHARCNAVEDARGHPLGQYLTQCRVWVLRCRGQHAEQLESKRLAVWNMRAMFVRALRMKVIMRNLDQLELVMVCDGVRRLCLRQVCYNALAEILLMYVCKQLVG